MRRFSQLSRLQRINLILVVIVVANWAISSVTGYSLIGSDLFVIFFLAFLVVLAVVCLRPLTQRLLWRVRNRLFVTYFLIGLVPVALLVTFVVLGFYLVLVKQLIIWCIPRSTAGSTRPTCLPKGLPKIIWPEGKWLVRQEKSFLFVSIIV